MSTDQRRVRGQAVIDRASLRMSAALLLAGQVLYILPASHAICAF
jgi:hypothetical protein